MNAPFLRRRTWTGHADQGPGILLAYRVEQMDGGSEQVGHDARKGMRPPGSTNGGGAQGKGRWWRAGAGEVGCSENGGGGRSGGRGEEPAPGRKEAASPRKRSASSGPAARGDAGAAAVDPVTGGEEGRRRGRSSETARVRDRGEKRERGESV